MMGLLRGEKDIQYTRGISLAFSSAVLPLRTLPSSSNVILASACTQIEPTPPYPAEFVAKVELAIFTL